MPSATNALKTDASGNTVISKLNEAELQQLAATSGGVYVHLTDIDAAVNTIEKQLNTIEETSLQDNAFKNYTSYFQWFIGLALFLLLIEFVFPERTFKAA